MTTSGSLRCGGFGATASKPKAPPTAFRGWREGLLPAFLLPEGKDRRQFVTVGKNDAGSQPVSRKRLGAGRCQLVIPGWYQLPLLGGAPGPATLELRIIIAARLEEIPMDE